MILDPTDQRIRDAGFNFVPFDRFLAKGFMPKTLDMSGTSALNQSNFGVPFNDSERNDEGINTLNTNREFNKKDNIFFERPDYEYDAAFPNAGRFDNILDTIKNYGMKAAASNMLSKGGAQLGFNVAGIPGALIGMLGGGALGFGARGPTDAEKVVANFYGNQGNTPMQYIDPETGELVDSLMQGYNISSAFGQGIPAAIQKRIDRIQNRKRAQTAISRKRVKDLQKELAALETEKQRQAKNMQDSNRAMGTGGYQSSFGGDSDFMEGPSDPGADLSSTMGSFMDGGRVGFQEGGSIEARLEQLGGDVTSAEQMLQGINERLQAAESSLGSGGANSVTINAGMQQPTVLGGGLGNFSMGGDRPDGLFNRPLPEFMQPKPQNLEQPIQTPSGQVQAFEQAFPGIPDSRPMGLAAADGTMSFLKPVPPEQQMEEFNTSQGKLSPEERVKNAEMSLLTRDLKSPQQLAYVDRVVKSGGMDYLVDLDFFTNPGLGLGKINSSQLQFQQPTFGTGGQGVMGGSRSPLQTALGFADGGIADMLDIYD